MMQSDRGGHGPDKATIVCVGEAYGTEERQHGRPFVGAAGQELRSWLRIANIEPDSVYYTNVINQQPFQNNFKKGFCLSKKDAEKEYPRWRTVLEMMRPDVEWPEKYNWSPIESGGYLHPKYLHEIYNLIDEVRAREPNLVIPLGNKACWAVLGQTKISKIRGAVAWSDRIGAKCLPMLHPAAILRQYEQRPLALADMLKAAREAEAKGHARPERELWLDPEIADLRRFDAFLRAAKAIGCDIETEPAAGLLKTVAFSADESKAIVLPFLDPRREDGSYWTADEEAEAWRFVESWCQLPQAKIFQNGVYDITWLWKQFGITVNEWDDTLLQAHALQPELPKDLGTLGSIYTNEPAWKLARSKSNKDAE